MSDLAIPEGMLQGGPLRAAFLGIQARLEVLFPPGKFTHGVVEPKLEAADWRELLRKTPFVGLGWGGAVPPDDVGRCLSLAATFTVFVAVRDLSGPKGRHLGDARAPGLFGMAMVAAGGLHGLTLREPRAPEPVGTIVVTDVSHLTVKSVTEQAKSLDRLHERELAIAAVDLRVPFEMPWLADADEWKSLAAEWQVNPPTDPDAPVSGPADAVDHVALQESPA